MHIHPRTIEKWKVRLIKSEALQQTGLTPLEALSILTTTCRMEVKTVLYKKYKNGHKTVS